MSAEQEEPDRFSEKIIRLIVNHSGAKGTSIQGEDYERIRIVFRYQKGSWRGISQGDYRHIQILNKIIKAWLKIQHQKDQSDA